MTARKIGAVAVAVVFVGGVVLSPATAVTGVTSRVSISTTGVQGNGYSSESAISADGRYVAFDSASSNLVPGDTNGVFDVFVRDRLAGTTSRVSVSGSGARAVVPGGGLGNGSFGPVISADGVYVAFISDAANLVPGDTNGVFDVFVRDRVAGTTSRVSVSSSGGQANGGFDSTFPPPSVSTAGTSHSARPRRIWSVVTPMAPSTCSCVTVWLARPAGSACPRPAAKLLA